MKRLALLYLIFLIPLYGAEMTSSIDAKNLTAFWNWFDRNQEKYHSFKSVDDKVEKLFDELTIELSKVHKDLTFEFGPNREKRELVISAGGHKSAFDAVHSLTDSAPKLDKWLIIKFRPRRTPINTVKYGKVELNPKSTYYQLFKDDNKIGVMLFNSGYDDNNKSEWGNAFYLILDECLGEYDVETKVGTIIYKNTDDKEFGKYWDKENILIHMPDHFDQMIKK